MFRHWNGPQRPNQSQKINKNLKYDQGEKLDQVIKGAGGPDMTDHENRFYGVF